MTAVIGRARELAGIEAVLDDVRAGRGRLALLSGPAGIGKSCLADAAAERARAHGLDVLNGYAVDDPGAPPLWPWSRVLQPAGATPTADGETDAAARFQLFVSVTDRLRDRAGAGTGLLVVLEDMHWADRLSALLLRHVATEIGAEPIGLVVTCREGVPGPLLDVLPDLVRGEAARPFPLSGLTPGEVATWVPALTGGADAELARHLHARTGGNPLLIRLVATDAARYGGGEDALQRVLADRPQLRHIVAGRVASLDAPARTVVEAAGVLGERIDAPTVAAMTGLAADDLRSAVTAATTAGVLAVGDDPGHLRFEHALVRDAVYAGLPAAVRSDLHRAAAVALGSGLRASPAGIVAHHWQRAEGADALQQCLAWAQRADEQARAALAFDDAVAYARLALDCGRRIGAPDAELAELTVRLAEALFLANFITESVATCLEAGELAERADRPDLMTQAALVVTGVGDPFAYRTIPRLCERALAAQPPDAHAVRARLQAQIAVGVTESEGGSRGAELAAEALAEAERSGDPLAQLEAIAARHLAITIPQLVEERLELGRRAVELGRSTHRPIAALWGHLWRADAAFQLGNLSEVDRELAEIQRVATERGSALARWHLHRFRAVRTSLVGDFDAARRENEAARRLAERMGDVSMSGMYFAFQTQLMMLRGDTGEIGDGFEELMKAAPPLPLVRVSIPLVHAVAGDHERARAEFAEFRHVPDTFPVGIRWMPTVTQIGTVAVLLVDAEVAATCYRVMQPLARHYSGDGSGAVFSHGAMSRLVADLARVAGRPDAAVEHYRDAVAMNSRIGARPFTALSRLGWAQTLLSAPSPSTGELAEAADLLSAAAAEFRRLDMPGPLATATRLSESVTRARKAVSPLSEREAEVAGLVAEALSNKEIATRLVLSERTVESHVRSILGKLGFTTRTEIATWAVRDAAGSGRIRS